MSNLLQKVKEADKCSSCGLERWPTYAATLVKITEKDEKGVYQSQELQYLAQVKEHFAAQLKSIAPLS